MRFFNGGARLGTTAQRIRMSGQDLVRHPRRAAQMRRAPKPAEVNERALRRELEKVVSGEVRFDRGSKGMYAVDASNYRQVPIGVVCPRSVEDVIETVRVCREHGAPVTSRGGGTSLAGQTCNVAVIIDWSKYLNQVLEIDRDRRIARVRPGVILDELRSEAVRQGLTFGPDPATHNHCTLGGMMGNNSCGVHALMAGKTVDNVEALEVLTYSGHRMRVGPTSDDELERIIRQGGPQGLIYARMKALRDHYAELIRQRYPQIPRRVSGYNLDELLPEKGFNVARALIGSEGTLVTILEAELRLVPEPKERALVVIGYPSIYQAADDVPRLLEFKPIGLEGVDDKLIGHYVFKKEMHSNIALLPDGRSYLFVEFGGDSEDEAAGLAHDAAKAIIDKLGKSDVKVFTDKKQMDAVWKVREGGLGVTARSPGGGETWEGWEDSAVEPARLGEYLRRLRALMDRYGYDASMYGHFGQGCLHCRLNFDLKSADGVARYRTFVHEAADLVLSLGGSLSGEHGDGQSRGELLPKMYGPELVQAFRELKQIWDPEYGMNPGKVVDPYRIDEHLRFGPGYAPSDPPTALQFPSDGHSFLLATERCVGVGECRRDEVSTMCPSYRVTHEERHSTRGRARLLHEMLVGEVIKDGWKSEEVKEALDLCLACKGCRTDCPVNVDMATYKAEFLSHYYQGTVRPRSAYAFGLIMYWAQLGGRTPGLANFVTQTPGMRAVAKRIAGIPPERDIPMFGAPSLQKRMKGRARVNEGATRVILWPDTFNNWFHPQTGMSGVEVLEAAGFDVIVPRGFHCCGRPLYDFGMLDVARHLLRQVLDDFREEIRAGTSFVVLEPSCASTFRDEMLNLFPHDLDAQRLRDQAFTLSEFLDRRADGFALPKLERKAVVHGHCHHKSVLGFDDERKVLTKLGVDAEVLDSGCCGMAGSFGFEKDKYEVSQKVGERVLLPKVREAPPDAVIVSDGFSCKTQVEQNTDRQALHLAELIKLALHYGPSGPLDGGLPENALPGTGGAKALARFRRRLALSAGAVTAALIGGFTWRKLSQG